MLHYFFLIFSILSTSVIAGDELSAQQWLEKMSVSMKKLNFYGTVAFFKNGRLDTMKYSHASSNGLQQERLLSLNSPMREVIREAGKVSCVFKDSNKKVVSYRPVSESFIVDLPVDLSRSSTVYQFSLGSEELVAMLPTRIITIEAKDRYRYDRKIWIDKQYFIPLKMEVYDLSGVMLEQIVFIDLTVKQKIKFVSAENTTANNKITRNHQQQILSVNNSNFILNNLPSGYKSVFYTRMEMGKSEQPVDHLLLSDGFSSVSVYRESKTTDVQVGLHTMGTVNSFTQVFDEFQITAMGEVPAKTVQFIAQGIVFR